MARQCFFIIILFLFSGFQDSFSQVEDPDPQREQKIGGDRRFRKWGQMDGNLINTPFINYGMVGNWPANPDPAEWPKGSGHTYVEGATPIIIAEVIDINGDLRHIAEVGYREDLDVSPEGIPYGYEPRPGWDNLEGPSPAMSNNPNTWPPVWPDKLKLVDDPGWPGSWNGFFGKNQFQADLESFFVMDDFRDKEFPFFPIPMEPERGGLATLVKVRGLQWSQVLAEDNIFWLYRITNFSDNSYAPVFFGALFDYGIGGIGDSGDDSAFFDTFIDIVYGFDEDNTGNTGFMPTAYAGFAFLESPGEPTDGRDNDEDGWIDERRDNPPGAFLDTFPYGYTDIELFRKSFGREPGPHWEGDEDGDWRPFSDENGNGVWDEGEALNDDVGRDGVRPGGEGYTGPDEGEGDGVPTQGEPNFGITDLDESDQIGLTSVHIFVTHQIGPFDDEKIWNSVANFTKEVGLQSSQTSLIYGSGPISLPAGETRDFSIAMLFGEDFDDLVRNKKAVQQIFNANYNFFKPPLKPRLQVVPGDGKVTLYWDRRAEESIDPFLNFKRDFEGYKIYRSTDAAFLEIKVITDAFGNSIFRKALVSFDLIDGIKGPDPVIGDFGASFDRGTDSGLRHVFVDSTVENGQRYFYAITAYDQGELTVGTEGIPVSETTSIINTDALGNVTFTDINTAVVTPNAPVAGFQPPEISQDITPVGVPVGSGTVSVEIVDLRLIKDNTTYQIQFHHTGVFQTESYSVVDVTASPSQTVLQQSKFFGRDKDGFIVEGEVFDGLRVFIDNDEQIAVIDSLTGWIQGNSIFDSKVEISTGAEPYPADYQIEFFDEIVGEDQRGNQTNFTVFNLTENREVLFRFSDTNGDGFWSSNERITIREFFEGAEKRSWRLTLTDTTGTGDAVTPGEGDLFSIKTFKPFRAGDLFEFTTKAASVDEQLAASSLDRIAVVPNPYVAAASWERKQTLSAGIGSRGQRRIDFIHLPQKATIRIYNMKGDLIDLIEHESMIDDGAASWDLRSREGLDVAFGIYVYHIDAGKLGQKLGKFAIIK